MDAYDRALYEKPFKECADKIQEVKEKSSATINELLADTLRRIELAFAYRHLREVANNFNSFESFCKRNAAFCPQTKKSISNEKNTSGSLNKKNDQEEGHASLEEVREFYATLNRRAAR